jgi:sec-independent protein translocase protein TatC
MSNSQHGTSSDEESWRESESSSEMENSTEDALSFWEHLSELRKRLLYSALATIITTIACWSFTQKVFEWITRPYIAFFGDATLIGTGPAEAFLLRLKLSIFCGILLASPIIFYQLWLFICPGLLEKEKKLALPFVMGSTFLFSLGTLFCFSVVLPYALEFFRTQYDSLGAITPTIRISEYLSMFLKAMLGFGLVFQIPILAFFLGKLGLITSSTLIHYGRYAVVAAFVISAILTPPDIVTQFLMAGPLLLLYGLSILIVRWTSDD